MESDSQSADRAAYADRLARQVTACEEILALVAATGTDVLIPVPLILLATGAGELDLAEHFGHAESVYLQELCRVGLIRDSVSLAAAVLAAKGDSA